MKHLLKLLLTLLFLFIGYELMVYALHLLDQPSDRAVYEGTAALAALLFSLPSLLFLLWRRPL